MHSKAFIIFLYFLELSPPQRSTNWHLTLLCGPIWTLENLVERKKKLGKVIFFFNVWFKEIHIGKFDGKFYKNKWSNFHHKNARKVEQKFHMSFTSHPSSTVGVIHICSARGPPWLHIGFVWQTAISCYPFTLAVSWLDYLFTLVVHIKSFW